MSDLLTVGLAGFAAAFVDGALGMGFGPTSSSILLTSGISPAGVSATVNIAKVATGLVSGVSHWRFGNIDRRLVIRLAVPGMVGAVVGTYILTNVDGDQLRPFLAILLILIGLRILLRFRMPIESATSAKVDHAQTRGVEIAGAAGGVTNGLIGAWGPVVTPFLLHRRVMPRIVVGSVNTAEVAVAFVAAGSLLTSASTGIDVGTVAAMLIGGVIAAPVAAWSVRFVPARCSASWWPVSYCSPTPASWPVGPISGRAAGGSTAECSPWWSPPGSAPASRRTRADRRRPGRSPSVPPADPARHHGRGCQAPASSSISRTEAGSSPSRRSTSVTCSITDLIAARSPTQNSPRCSDEPS